MSWQSLFTSEPIPTGPETGERGQTQGAELSDTVQIEPGKIPIAKMHPAKRIEFRGVLVMAYDHEIIQLQQPIEDVADLKEVHCVVRHLLQVARMKSQNH